MKRLWMCRICLATDVRLYCIAMHLQDIYEKLTTMTFKEEDNRPLVACNICLARLRSCYRLRTSCIQSEKQLKLVQQSGVLVQHEVSSTNTLSVVSVLNISLGHELQDDTECHLEEEPPEVIHDDELDQQNIEDIKMQAQEEYELPIDDDLQCSHLEDPLDVIKCDPDDIETDITIEAQEEHDVPIKDDLQCPLLEIKIEPDHIQTEAENIIIRESNGEPDVLGPASLSADNICPKVMNVVLERMVLNDTKIEPKKDYRKGNKTRLRLSATRKNRKNIIRQILLRKKMSSLDQPCPNLTLPDLKNPRMPQSLEQLQAPFDTESAKPGRGQPMDENI